MKRKNRRFLLFGIIAIFLIIAPLTLLYAVGYGFDFSQKKIVKTGAIDIRSTPTKSLVYLDGGFDGKTPKLIKRLLPQQHEIQVTKEGYSSWQKRVEVKSQVVEKFTDILLVPTNPQIKLVQQDLDPSFSLSNWLKDDQVQDLPVFFKTTSLEIAGWQIINNYIYYLAKPNYILYRSNLLGQEVNQISNLPLAAETYQLNVSSDKIISLLDSKNNLYLFNPENKSFELIAEKVKNSQFAPDNRKLLYFTENELWVYYLEEITSQPQKQKGEKELITRLSQPIEIAVWYPQTSKHIFYTSNDCLKVTELDGRAQRNTFDFINQAIDQITFDKDKIYFVAQNRLFQTSLLQD